jgi:hypothetical protein
MHIRKTSILIFSLALVGLLAFGLAAPFLKTSVIQFSMSIATSPEEPIEPEEPEEPEPQDGKGSGGGAGTPKDSEPIEPIEPVEPEEPMEPVEPVEPAPIEPEEPEPSKPEETSGGSSSVSTPENLPVEESPLKIVQKPAQVIEDVEELINIPPSEELPQTELEQGTKQAPDLLELNLSAFCEDVEEAKEETFLSKIFSQITLWWQILKQLVQQHLF